MKKLYLITALLFSIVLLANCNTTTQKPVHKEEYSKPIEIVGLSLTKAAEENMKTIVTKTGCEPSERDQGSCCHHPIKRSGDKKMWCTESGTTARIGKNGFTLNCQAYSGCQYSFWEVKELLKKIR